MYLLQIHITAFQLMTWFVRWEKIHENIFYQWWLHKYGNLRKL